MTVRPINHLAGVRPNVAGNVARDVLLSGVISSLSLDLTKQSIGFLLKIFNLFEAQENVWF